MIRTVFDFTPMASASFVETLAGTKYEVETSEESQLLASLLLSLNEGSNDDNFKSTKALEKIVLSFEDYLQVIEKIGLPNFERAS